jgi:hypothetical protein
MKKIIQKPKGKSVTKIVNPDKPKPPVKKPGY